MQRTGWFKDERDDRDYLHPTVSAALLPDKVNLSNLLPDVRDQEDMQACVGFCLGSNITGTARGLRFFEQWHSPQWIWNGARKERGWLNYNCGVYPRDACNFLVKSGCLYEFNWKFSGTVLDSTDPDEYINLAFRYPQFEYYRCVDGVDGICSALADGHLVSIGSPWSHKWGSLSPDGTLPHVTKDDFGRIGHAYLVYGYDRLASGGGQLLCQNSWGSEWGDGGRFRLCFDDVILFKLVGGYDAHYFTFELVPEPLPPLPPEPIPDPIPDPDLPESNWFIRIIKAIVRFLVNLKARKV